MLNLRLVLVVFSVSLVAGCSDSQTPGSDSGLTVDGGSDAALADAMIDAARCPIDCDDDTECTVDACDEATGTCTHEPGVEVCDAIDNDCDNSVDEDLMVHAWYIDRDADGRGDINADPVLSCGTVDGHSIHNDDCDDNNRAIRPGAPDRCNGFDDDCDAMVDENVSVLRYADADGDGRGAGEPIAVCAGTVGFVQFDDDCDDNNRQVHPGLSESCDQLDNDCDAIIDETLGCVNFTCEVALATICDPNATCTELGGDAVCSCHEGFLDLSGSGRTGIICTDVDECRADLDICDDNATCNNTLGSYTCTCIEGYLGNGLTCTPN